METIIRDLLTAAIANGYTNRAAIERLNKHADTLAGRRAKKGAPSKSTVENNVLANELFDEMTPGVPYTGGDIRAMLIAITGWGDVSPQKTTAVLRQALNLKLISRNRDDATGKPLYVR